jgi:SAM-dependent methyltransferase
VQIIKRARRRLARLSFRGSADYWQRRYQEGGTSGGGSYGRLARFKADFLNTFVAEHGVTSVLELGCGDGAQVSLAEYPSYLGLDVAPSSVSRCKERFADDPTKMFGMYPDDLPTSPVELGLSLDVVYHLVEDRVFETHLRDLFTSSSRWVVIYSSNEDRPRAALHVRHRRFTDWVEQNAPGWTLTQHVPNPYPASTGREERETSFADFYVFAPAT